MADFTLVGPRMAHICPGLANVGQFVAPGWTAKKTHRTFLRPSREAGEQMLASGVSPRSGAPWCREPVRNSADAPPISPPRLRAPKYD